MTRSSSSSGTSTPVSMSSTLSLSENTEKEEALLECIFTHVAQFNFDRGKELADREREGSPKLTQGLWIAMLNIAGQFTIIEKSFQALVFLQPKGFLRKESTLKSNSDSLRLDLRKLEEGRKSGHLERVVSQIAGELGMFLSARLDQMEFYEKLFVLGASGKQMNFEDLAKDVTELSAKYHAAFQHPSLASLNMSFSLECGILSQLIQAQVHMQQWHFFPSLLHLHEAHSKLAVWETILQNKEFRKTSFTTSFLKSSNPCVSMLYQWLWKLKGTLLSKFSLYFYDTLSKQWKQIVQQDMKILCTKLLVDYVQKIQAFQRKVDACSICLVFDTQTLDDYKGPGYHHPLKQCEPSKGLEIYPAVFSYPEKPTLQWSNLVLTINDRAAELNNLDRVVHVYDNTVHSTFYLCKADPRMILVLMFSGKRSEKDNSIITFLTEICLHLRCNRVFASLKPGSK